MRYLLLNLALIIIGFGSCKSFIQIDPPKDQLVTGNVYESDETANAALLTVYALMFNSFNASPFHTPYYTGICGDELVNNVSSLTDLYQNAINPVSNSSSNPFWSEAYKFIYMANSVYEGCTGSTSLNPDVKKQLMAEAMFIRAYWNFYLVNLYGDVPLIKTTDYKKNASLPRNGTDSVYQQVIDDLIYARDNLNENYVDAGSLQTTSERVRPNRYAAIALLARVYLYTGKYKDAEDLATTIIERSSVYSLTTTDAVFLKNSQEAIWQLMATNNPSINTQEGYGFILSGPPAAQGKANISAWLMDAFEPGDLRKDNWVGVISDDTQSPAVIYYFPYKYKVQIGGDLTEYSMIIRLAEMYLIRAEARNEQGNINGAVTDLNIIRKRARGEATADVPDPLPALTNTLNKQEVASAILHERQIELFTEQGHRWLDLKRTGSVDTVMMQVEPVKSGNTWNPEMQIWPIPQSEILNNPLLTQNPGYN